MRFTVGSHCIAFARVVCQTSSIVLVVETGVDHDELASGVFSGRTLGVLRAIVEEHIATTSRIRGLHAHRLSLVVAVVREMLIDDQFRLVTFKLTQLNQVVICSIVRVPTLLLVGDSHHSQVLLACLIPDKQLRLDHRKLVINRVEALLTRKV